MVAAHLLRLQQKAIDYPTVARMCQQFTTASQVGLIVAAKGYRSMRQSMFKLLRVDWTIHVHFLLSGRS
jgi:hypothetical protein